MGSVEGGVQGEGLRWDVVEELCAFWNGLRFW